MLKRILFAALMLLSLHAGAQRWGVINYSANYLRLEPDYESPLETQELMGTVVEILDSKGYWLKVKSPQPYVAWCTNLGVVEMNGTDIENYRNAPKYIVTAIHSKVLDSRGFKPETISDLVQGDILRIATRTDRKGRVVPEKPKGGYAKVMLPDGRCGFVPAKDVEDLNKWANSRKATTRNLVQTAKQYLGIPYLWGGMSTKGFDCSGFVRTVYIQNGVFLPRNASQMVGIGVEVTDFSKLKAGDLLFFGQKGNMIKKEKITHVGMYIGEGRFIHSSHVVRINSLDPEAPDYYPNATKLVRAFRLADTKDIQERMVCKMSDFTYICTTEKKL